MLETMYSEGGIGLAATQVNIQERIVVIDLSEDKNEPINLINPEILKLEGKEVTQEGCLSVPDYFDVVERAKNIEFRFSTIKNEIITKKFDDHMLESFFLSQDEINASFKNVNKEVVTALEVAFENIIQFHSKC